MSDVSAGGPDLAAIRALLGCGVATLYEGELHEALSSLLAAYEAQAAQVTKLETAAREAMRKAEVARAEERAAVIAELRAEGRGVSWGTLSEAQRERLDALEEFADRFERGEHTWRRRWAVASELRLTWSVNDFGTLGASCGPARLIVLDRGARGITWEALGYGGHTAEPWKRTGREDALHDAQLAAEAACLAWLSEGVAALGGRVLEAGEVETAREGLTFASNSGCTFPDLETRWRALARKLEAK
jgi:hypothetical protein